MKVWQVQTTLVLLGLCGCFAYSQLQPEVSWDRVKFLEEKARVLRAELETAKKRLLLQREVEMARESHSGLPLSLLEADESVVDDEGSFPDHAAMLGLRATIIKRIEARNGTNTEAMLTGFKSKWPLRARYCSWKYIKCDESKRVTSLRVRSLGAGELPREIYQLEGLTALMLGRPKVSFISPAITALKRLKTLIIVGARNLKFLPQMPASLRSLKVYKCTKFRGFSQGFDWSVMTSLRTLSVTGSKNLLPSIFDGLDKALALEELHFSSSTRSFFADGLVKGLLGGKFLNLRRLEVVDLTRTGGPVSRLPFAPRLQRIVLQGFDMTRIPDVFGSFTSLTHLQLRYNKITRLPLDFLSFPKLKVLNVKNNRITQLSDADTKMMDRAKVRIHLAGNPVYEVYNAKELRKKFGPAVKLLEELHSMNLTASLPPVSALPCTDETDSIFICQDSSSIATIYLTNLGLREVPKSLAFFVNAGVKEVDLSRNYISSIPGGIFEKMDGLNVIKFNANRLDSIHPGFFDSSIDHYYLNGNRLEGLPEGFEESRACFYAYSIDLSTNRLSEFPESLNKCHSFTIVKINHNNFKQMPRSFLSMSKLQELELMFTGITSDMLKGIVWNSKLDSLALQHNHLTEVPIEIFKSGATYRYVGLHHNKISKIPDELVVSMESVKQGFSAKVVDLSHNNIEDVPNDFWSASISDLMLSHNNVRTLTTDDFINCTMHRIDLASNRIETIIPSSHTREDMSVEEMNKIFVEHRSLKAYKSDELRLSVSNNRIKGIPSSFVALMSFVCKKFEFSTTANPIESMPQEYFIGESGITIFDMMRFSVLPSVMNGDDGSNRTREAVVDDITAIHTQFLDISGAKLLRSIPEVDSMIRYFSQASETSPIGEGGVWVLEEDQIPEFKDCLEYEYQCNNRVVGLVVCLCIENFYAGIMDPDRCRQCPMLAKCKYGKAQCSEATFERRVELSVASNKEADFRPEIECSICTDGGVCDGNNIIPKGGFWKPDVESNLILSCPNPEACQGGDDSQCSQGYEGIMCGKCVDGYYASGAHTCVKCPNPITSIVFFSLSVVGIVVFGLVFFLVAASSLENSRSKSAKREMRMQNLGNTLQSTNALKLLVGFFQIITAMDLTFDLDWPRPLILLDSIFGFVNLDFMKASSLECVWELTNLSGPSEGKETVESAGFGYKQKMSLTACIPMGVSFLLLFAYYGTKWALKIDFIAKRAGTSAASVKRLCINTHILTWQLCYLPVSYLALQYFNCVSIDGGLTYYIHNDLSTMCYDGKYWAYSSAAILIIVLYTIGLPLATAAFIFLKRNKLNDESMSSHWGVLYRSYRKEYPYWESVEMVRKVIIGGGVVLLSGSPIFQLTVALLVLFIFTVLHCRCWPNENNKANMIQGLVLVLTYLNMALGLLKTLEVPKTAARLFTVVVIGIDFAFAALVCFLLLVDSFDIFMEQVKKLVQKAKKHTQQLSNAVKGSEGH